MTAHKHAHLMMQYAQDAMETDKPWERWEFRPNGITQWFPRKNTHPNWDEHCEYRRKPRTITVNGHELPEPVREPLRDGTFYFVPDPAFAKLYTELVWGDEKTHLRCLHRGLVYRNPEYAIAWAEAWLSFAEVGDE